MIICVNSLRIRVRISLRRPYPGERSPQAVVLSLWKEDSHHEPGAQMAVRTKLWTRDEFERLVAAGAFPPDARIQLVDGEIVEMTAQGAAHATAVYRLQKALEAIFDHAFIVRAQLPIALAGDSMSIPGPDIAVVRGSADDFRVHHPSTAVLLVEVADASIQFDRTRKLAMYARAGIPEYWILDINDSSLEVNRDPDRVTGSYRERTTLSSADHVVSVSGNTVRLPVNAILP